MPLESMKVTPWRSRSNGPCTMSSVELGGGGEVDLAGDGESPWGTFDDCDWSEYWCHPHPSREMGGSPVRQRRGGRSAAFGSTPRGWGRETPRFRTDAGTGRSAAQTIPCFPDRELDDHPFGNGGDGSERGLQSPVEHFSSKCSPRLMVGFLPGSGCICTVGVPGPARGCGPASGIAQNACPSLLVQSRHLSCPTNDPRRPRPLLPHPGRSLRRVGRALRAQRRRGPGAGRSRGGRLLGDATAGCASPPPPTKPSPRSRTSSRTPSRDPVTSPTPPMRWCWCAISPSQPSGRSWPKPRCEPVWCRWRGSP